MGLRAAASVGGKTKEVYTARVTFTYLEGKPYFDTGKVTNRFTHDTLGKINGFIVRQIHDPTEYDKKLKNKNEHQISRITNKKKNE